MTAGQRNIKYRIYNIFFHLIKNEVMKPWFILLEFFFLFSLNQIHTSMLQELGYTHRAPLSASLYIRIVF